MYNLHLETIVFVQDLLLHIPTKDISGWVQDRTRYTRWL